MTKRLSILNDPPTILEGPQLLHELIRWEQHSKTCAIDFTSKGKRQRYSYRDVQICVESLQSRICEGLAKSQLTETKTHQHIIPILLPQSPGLYVSQLAILQSGGAFCPINLDAPKDRIKFVVDDVSAELIITTSEFENVVSWENGPFVILVDEFPSVGNEQPRESATAHEVTPDDISYVMYTSGSSGTPKGVAISHLAVSQSLLAHEKHIPRFDRFLQFAAPSFDVSVFEIFFPLVRGSTLVGCNRSQLLDDLPGMITELEIDAAELTPTVVGSLFQKRSNAPGLKVLLTVGEMLTTPIVKEFGGSKTQSNMLYGMYGPTEASIHCTVYPKMEADAKPGNIGIPFETVSTFIASASTSSEDASKLKILPIGELGELVLGGPQLARGYLNREEQNRAAFVHLNDKVYYRTGDKARQLENGTIEILGRISAGQVKLRGQRVELGEIEEVAYKHSGLKTVVAVVLNGVLVMFALTDNLSIKSENVLETCTKWLPKFMIPSEVVLLQKFPYLPSGKGSTETDQVVKTVLQETLGKYSFTTRLAAAGIDSLVAIRVASKLRGVGYSVNTLEVLQAETLNSLVELCDNSKPIEPVRNSNRLPTKDPIKIVLNGHAKDVEYTMLCTPLQSAMLSETAIDRRAYRNWIELELTGIHNVEDVISGLHDLADANPILRTGFAEPNDRNGYVQIIWRSLAEYQIAVVERFQFEFEESKDTSLHRPVRFQVLHFDADTKLLIHIHHALYDAWSLELMFDDLNTLLLGRALSHRPPFSDVVDGYQTGLLLPDAWSSKDYWKDHLALLDAAQLPNFHTKQAPPPSLAIAQHRTSLSTSGLEAAARQLLSSPQSLFQAAYALVLSSYMGSSDICFGTVFSGRTLPIAGIEDIAGPCLATLPIRVDISTSTDLQGLVQELNSTNRKHLQHSTLPLRDIKATNGNNPRQLLFDTLLIWQQTLHSYDHKREHVVLVDTVDNLEFNLTLEVIPSSDNIVLNANYQQALFPPSQIEMLLSQVEQLVKAILKDASTSLETVFSHLKKSVVSIENENPNTELKSGTLSSAVENLAISYPDRPAIEFAKSIDEKNIDTNRISYSELNSYSNQIGNYLIQEHGVLPDELVCICMEKSIELYACILATAKIGAGHLPLTPDVPHDRLQHILHEAKIRVVMAQSTSRPLLKLFKFVKVFYIDEFSLTLYSVRNIPPRSTPDMVSYCVFTSGSTGTPKGVLVTQGNLLSNLDVLQDLYPTNKHSRFLQSCSQAFDVSVFEIFFAWRVGGTICSAVKDVLFRDIENAIRMFNITHLSLTPTVAALIDPEKVPRVEFLVTAGEGVTSKVFNAWADRGLWQGYGPSETTNICTVNPRVTKSDAINNIGPPFKNTSVFLLAPGPKFILVPRGGVGEFCFGGSQVFRGYMDSDQDIGKIIDHPEFGRLYRTGDFGRLMLDGSLVFTGRIDDQVKIRGQRVELGEINNIMLNFVEVTDCVTMVISSETDSSQSLICFWTTDQDASGNLRCLNPDLAIITKLYKGLDSVLPAYMIPSALIPISFMPSTAQGKIDKRLLVKLFQDLDVKYLDQTSQASRSASDHTWTQIQKMIAKGVSEVVGVPFGDIGPDTSFFSLGIDSISAIQLSKSLTKHTMSHINISDILKFPSVVKLAERIESQSGKVQTDGLSLPDDTNFGFAEDFIVSTTANFERAGKSVKFILPCTPLQEAMLSAAEASSENLYGNQVTLDIRGDIAKLENCWREMVRRHDILRTCFVATDMPRYPFIQVVLEDYDMNFTSIRSIEDKKPQKVFEPPYSLNFKQSSGTTQLVISMHHALYDGVALAVLYDEVEKKYRSDVLPASISFSPFLKSMVSMDMDEADNFWISKLGGCSFPKLDSMRANIKGYRQETRTNIQRISGKSALSWLEENTRKHSTSLLAACHTAWAALLAERLQETDVCFGNIVSGRTLPVEGIERLVAPCFNTIPSRLQNIHQLSYLEAFRRLQSLNADSLRFQMTPLRRIQSKLSSDGSRLFDTLFILQQPPRDLDSSIWSLSDESGAMDFPLVCEVVPRPSDDTLELILHSYSSVISTDDALVFLQALDEKLRVALQNPRRQILSPAMKEGIMEKLDNQQKSTPEESAETPPKPFSPDELKIREIISSFTNVPAKNIRRDMSIFRLGLDSISTVQVATRLRKQGHNTLASDILENPTIAQLSAFLFRSEDGNSRVVDYDFQAFDDEHREVICSKIGLASENVEAVLPCTSVQRGMLAQTLHSEGLEYVNSIWFQISPEASVSKLRDAWRCVCEKNEILRTVFVTTESSKHPFVMVVQRKEVCELPWYESAEELPRDLGAEDFLQKPWSLSLFEEDGVTILRFTAHHALYDAQSIRMLLADVARIYANQSPSAHPPVKQLIGAILQASLHNQDEKKSFWEKDENKIIVNRFPDLTPLRVTDTSSAVKELTSQSSSVKIEELCRSNGVTVQAATQATWARLLAFYIGEISTTFGMTLSGRSIHENADQIAFPSIVTLPVRCEITGTNAELLSRTMNANASLHKHQFTPLTSIQKWAGYPEGKIFDTLFTFQKLSNDGEEADEPWKIVKEEAFVDFAISLEVQPTTGNEMTLRLTFQEDLIPTEQAELLLQQYDALLLDILENPQNSCDIAPRTSNSLLSITAAEEDVLTAPVTLLHEFVELGAREFPDRNALEFATNIEPDNFKSTYWTYSQLNQEANKIANMLLQRNVDPGQMIAICFDKCAEASFTIIGILKSGCSYVALDPNAPADRLKFIVKDSGAKMVVTAGKPGQNIAGILDGEIINLDSPDILQSCSSEQPRLSRNILPEDDAYCLYTSGTTGTPKGCLITHENTVQFMLAFSVLFAGHWDEDSKYLQFASFHFDVSVMEQFWSWSVGICVASAPRDLIFEDITGAIQQLAITHIDLTPSLARLIHPDEVPTLCKGAFITGGEQLRQEILDVWGEHACIYNGYGPTEATIGCTMYPRVPKNGKPSNIGPAYINVGSFVLKPGTELPVLRGGIGELCVSGKLVGKGYLNRPDLTAERFPTLKSFNERVYRTGDLVRILHDGSFIFLGRADDQVKLRGQRLELSEINEVIKNGVDGIEEIVTLVLKHSTQQKEQLVTFFVTNPQSDSQNTPVSPLRDTCKARLPGYMVPTHFIPINALPLNANNKSDSKQLAAMYNELKVEDLQRLSQSDQDDNNWTDCEQQVLDVISNVLSVDATALTGGTTIFEFGVDSISIIGFARSLQSAGLGNAKLSVVKNNTSVKALVRALLEGNYDDQGRENAYIAAAQDIAAFEQRHRLYICGELGVESVDVEKIAPCTPVQEGMIYRFLESESPLYFNKFDFELDVDVDLEQLLSAWNRVIKKLEVLRMKFVTTDDGFAQVILRAADTSSYQEFIDYGSEEKAAALRMPYSFTFQSTSEVKTMKLQMFHGLYDGNSLKMLLRCVVDEYHEKSTDYGPLFTSSLPYGPLAHTPGARAFWTSHLNDWSSSQMPDSLESTIDIVAKRAVNLSDFDDVRKKLGVTPQALVQAAWVSTLQTLTSSNLTIGIVTSGRAIDFDDADKVIGPLFNTIPFHIKLGPGAKSCELVTKCHDFNMQMQDFQHTPLKNIQKWSSAKPGQSLFDTLFVFQRPEVEDVDFAKGVWRETGDEIVADYSLAFEATLSPDNSKLSLTIVAQGSTISQSSADDLLCQFKTIILDMLESSGENVISGSVTKDENDPATQDRLSSPFPSSIQEKTPSGLFTWTDEAKAIRTEIAALAKVSADDVKEISSIFELGLDSIDVIKLASRLKKQGIEIPVSTMVKSQTIAKIILNMSAKKTISRTASGQTVQEMSRELTTYLKAQGKLPENFEAVLPATPLQQSMVNEMINSGYKRYFNVDGFELGEGIDLEKLRNAVISVIRESPILRTTFVEVDDPKSAVSFAQIIHGAEETMEGIASKITRLQEGGSFESYMKAFETEAARVAEEDQQLLQVQFVEAETSKYLVIAISHALYDGKSLRAIHDNIQKSYHGSASPRPDFIPFLGEVFESTTEDAKRFWRTTLSNLPTAIFPRQDSGTENASLTTRLERRSRVPLKDIESLCKSARITPQALGQTCWALVLSQLMGQLDVVFGSVLSCRDSEEAGSVMFPLMNTVAVRSIIHGSLSDMLKYMQDMSDTTRQYQHFPLGTAQAYALASRHDPTLPTDTRLFDTLFIYQGRRQTKANDKLYESIYGVSDVEFPVCVEMEIVDDEFLSWTTACKGIARNTEETEGILEALDQVLGRIVSDPEVQTIMSVASGVSVCGLPSFRIKEQKQQPTPQTANSIDHTKWSISELAIRNALHVLSGIPEESIRKDSTIFHLGLDSISVLKLPALLKKSGMKLSVSIIMKEQTVLAMAKAAQVSGPDVETSLDVDKVIADAISDLDLKAELADLKKDGGEIDYVMPATAGEEYMIRQWQISQGAMFYQTFTYALCNAIDRAELELAWKTLLARHDILRTGFIEVQSKLVQVVFKTSPNDVIYPTQENSVVTRKSSSNLRLPPLDLVVVYPESSKPKIMLVLHHALYDGVSLPIILNELQSLYRGNTLKPTNLDFKTFVAQSISAAPLAATKDKWTTYLNHGSDTAVSHPPPITSNKRTEVYHPSTPIKPLRRLAQEMGVSTDALFLAALCKIHARTLQQRSKNPQAQIPRVILGIYLANRAPFDSDLSSLAAPTLNLLPLCIVYPLKRSIEDVARHVQSDIRRIGSQDMVSASLQQIYEWTGTRVDCFVNILRSGGDVDGSSGSEEWTPVQDLGTRAEVMDTEITAKMVKKDAGEGAYLPSVDIELRYHGETIDMGVFAPEEMLSVKGAEKLIGDFIAFWK
ncbi:related to non-ribosomal peptide synthetase [Rhynchosporium secalis]|uniref:Related to non-ribosomal peptide synthetase n=1 Tax=Rhynchosporium secalis TaxID=38038 RepID=A0A1E1M8I6_RHYSE|nr:related to non-ribosomal peptide synthetase [Rhynchosporium secalis]